MRITGKLVCFVFVLGGSQAALRCSLKGAENLNGPKSSLRSAARRGWSAGGALMSHRSTTLLHSISSISIAYRYHHKSVDSPVTYCTLSVTFSHLTTTTPPLAKLKEIIRMPQQRTGAAGGGGEGGGGGGRRRRWRWRRKWRRRWRWKRKWSGSSACDRE